MFPFVCSVMIDHRSVMTSKHGKNKKRRKRVKILLIWRHLCFCPLIGHEKNQSKSERNWAYQIKSKWYLVSKEFESYFSLDHVVSLFSHLCDKAIHVYHLLSFHLLHQRVYCNEGSRASDTSTEDENSEFTSLASTIAKYQHNLQCLTIVLQEPETCVLFSLLNNVEA